MHVFLVITRENNLFPDRNVFDAISPKSVQRLEVYQFFVVKPERFALVSMLTS